MKPATTIFKSRWGFHPCNYELFLKLKGLHGCYWKTLYDFHRWHRWWRKDVQNRTGPEPTFCPLFVNEYVWYKPVRVRGEQGFKVYPKTVTDHGIVDLYQTARIPHREAVVPFDAETHQRIESLYEEMETQMSE